jgi:hypothetical protein
VITPGEIRAVIEQPSELPATATADDYLMEKFQRVAVEAVATYMAGDEHPCPDFHGLCPRTDDGEANCRACWREALKREGK